MNNTQRPGRIENRYGHALSRRTFFKLTGATAVFALIGKFLNKEFSFDAPGKAFAAEQGKTKNILVVTGSARIGGNSYLLAEAFAKGARESGHTVNIFRSGQDRMSGCLFCGGC